MRNTAQQFSQKSTSYSETEETATGQTYTVCSVNDCREISLLLVSIMMEITQ